MTAERWWVQWAARWLARAEAVAPLVRMGMLTMTGLSTALIGLKQYGYSEYAWPLIGVVLGGALVFTYFYAEGGVWNQKNRDSVDMGTNFVGPSMLMDDVLTGVAVFSAVHNRPPDEDELATIEQAVSGRWHEYRDGVDLEDVQEVVEQ